MTQYEIATLGDPIIWYDGPISYPLHWRGHLGEAHAYDEKSSVTFHAGWIPNADMLARYHARCIDLLTIMTDPDTLRFTFNLPEDRNSDGTVRMIRMQEPFPDECLPLSGYFHGDL